MDAIRADKPYNEAERGVMASLVTSLGRKAAHTGREITLEDMLNSDHEYAPDADKWTMDSPPPLKAGRRRQVPHPAARHHHVAGILRAGFRRDIAQPLLNAS